MPGLQYTPCSHKEGVAGIPRGLTYAMATRKRLSYTVGTKLQAMEVALKRTTTQEILYGVSGLLCGCPKSLQQCVHRVCCPSPVLYVESRQLYWCDGLSLHLPSCTGTSCVRVGVKEKIVHGLLDGYKFRASNKSRPVKNAGYYKPLK